VALKATARTLRSPVYVFGNSFASIVAVSELVKHDRRFLWIQDGLNVDGIWRGLKYKNRTLDLGMINFEFDVRHPESLADLDTYSQYRLNDCARFSDYVFEYVTQYCDTKLLPKILVYENQATHHDHLISNDFSHLKRFKDLSVRNIEDPFEKHPSEKYTLVGKELLLDISYDEYVNKFYGSEIANKLFLPWAYKLIGENVKNANTLRHRAAWLPLPYPETIFEAVSGDLKEDYSYSFHYPAGETFSELVNSVFDGLCKDESIEKVQAKDLSDQEIRKILNSDSKIFWGSKLESFLRMNEQFSKHELSEHRSLIDLNLYEVELEPDFSDYVFLNNDLNDSSWYRLTILPNVVLEGGLQIAIVESRELRYQLHDASHFSNLGVKIVNHIKSLHSVPVFLSLDGAQHRKYESWHQLIVDEFPNINFGGGASFAYSATFSDQVVQGIQFARRECKDDVK
jgi:hypothetical protein